VTKKLLDAGCDLALHSDCSRDFAHTVEILEAAPVLDDSKAQWLLDKMTFARTAPSFDVNEFINKLNNLMKI
jgi:hypothetical protein